VREEMVPLALKKGDHNEPHDQRVFGCNLIGRLCRRLEGSIIVAEVLDRALRLCQDTETSVRVAVCEQICDIARCIGLALTKSRIADELIQLIYDEEWPVCRAAFTALIDLVEFFDPPYRREHVYGIIKSFVTSPPDTVATLLIEEFGRMLTKIKAEMPPEDVVCFANFFRISATKADQDIRRLCAFNLPAVVASLPLSTYPTHIAQIQKNLAVDQHPPVRRAVAAGMHELCPFLADKAANYLKESFVALIQDPTLEVRAALVQNLSTMLAVFNSQLKGEEREQFFNFLVPHLVGYESAVQKDWRKVSVLFSNFLQFPQYFNGQILHDRFLPILKFHLTKGAAAIKEQCAELLILFSRHMGSSRFTMNVFSMLISDFGRAESCLHRMTFPVVFKHCVGNYSRRFLRHSLLGTLLDLSKDVVPNVRVQFVRVLPAIRRCLKEPKLDPTTAALRMEGDADYKAQYLQALQRCQEDPDPEVQMCMSWVINEIERIESEYAMQASRKGPAPDDVEDGALEEAEGDLLEFAKQQEELERRERLRELREMLERENAGRDMGRPGAKTAGVPGKTAVRPTPGAKPAVRPTPKATGTVVKPTRPK